MTGPAIEAAELEEAPPPNNPPGIEESALLLALKKVDELEEKTRKELKDVKERQEKIRLLHTLTKAINKSTTSNGKLNLEGLDDLKELLRQAKELGVEVDLEKTTYTRDERDRLIENIRMSSDDLTLENDMQVQTVTRMTNERYEAYQLARSMLRPLHDAKLSICRSIKAGG